MIFEQIRVGGDRNFAYLIGDPGTGAAAIVDPAYTPEKVLARCAELGLTPRYLINTHGHHDHVNGNDHVLSHSDAVLLAWGRKGVHDGRELALGSVTLTFLHTPGHTQDSICILVTAAGQPPRLITGDILFVGKVGGTDLAEGARTEYASLHEKIMVLADETEVWPGHDYGVAPHSTIGQERAGNPFLLRTSLAAFIELKANWAEYKREHGIA